MPFITQGKNNWKFLGIAVVLAVVVGIGILWCVKTSEQSYPLSETKQPEKVTEDETADLVPSEVEGWLAYRNEEYGFEFKYPPEIYGYPSGEPLEEIIIHEAECLRGRFSYRFDSLNFFYLSVCDQEEKTLQQWVAEDISKMLLDWPAASYNVDDIIEKILLNAKDVTVSGKQGIKVFSLSDFRVCSAYPWCLIVKAYFSDNGRIFSFGLYNGGDFIEEKEELIDQMLSTFRFIELPQEGLGKITVPLKDFDNAKDAIISYLNQYPDNIDILDKLFVEYVADIVGIREEKIIKWTKRADLNNDGTENLIIGFSDPFMTEGRPMVTGFPYSFAVFSERETGYEAAFVWEGRLSSYYPMHFIRDVNNDNRLEVAVGFMWCGAHTCGRSITAIQWDGQNWRDLTPDIWIGDANFDAISIEWLDLTGDGMENIKLYGGTAGSVGAGMQRRRTEIYAYKEGRYQLIETKMDPAENIYHLMLDINEVLRKNKPNEALVLTKKAFQEPDWGVSAYITEEDQARIISYTAMQEMLIHFQQLPPDLNSAEFLLGEIKQKYDKPDNPYIGAAQALYDTYINTEDVIEACKAMEKEILGAGDDAEFLHWYGYNTERLDFSNICPLSAEIEIKLYFPNWSRYQKLQEELCPDSYCPGRMHEKYGVNDCDYSFPVIRHIPRQKTSLDFIELALKELSKGPNQDEKAQGFGEAGPFAEMIEDFEVEEGVLILKFNKEMSDEWWNNNFGIWRGLSSCECMLYYGPIMRALDEIIKIIPGVKEHAPFC